MIIHYQNNTGNTSASTGTSNFLLGSSLSKHISLSSLVNKYVPYYIEHSSASEFEYGLGYVYLDGSDYILARGGSSIYTDTAVYTSSNSNNKVSFSSGTKNVTAVISAERILHGGNNIERKTTDFIISDDVQAVYAVKASGSDVNAYLPTASEHKNLVIGFRVLEDSADNLIINPSGSDFIDGSGANVTVSPTVQYTSLVSDGSGWLQLNRDVDLTTVGLPNGTNGNIQFKSSSTDFGGNNKLHWDSSNELLLVGGNTSGTANMVFPADGATNTVINQDKYNSNFDVKGTGTYNLFFDASKGRLGVNTSTPTSILHIVGRCANENFKIESTSNCPTGVGLTLYHSPDGGSSDGDLPAFINLAGRNSNGQRVNYGKITSKILDTAINNTSGEIIISVDYKGDDKNLIVGSPQRTAIGLDTHVSQNDNISIGNFVVSSGNDNIVVGHKNVINNGSNNNVMLTQSGEFIGSDSILIGSSSQSSGNNIFVLGTDSFASGNHNFAIGQNSSIVGSNTFVEGFSNTATGYGILIYGHNNTVTDNSGIVIGFKSINQSGIVVGNTVSNTGNNITIANNSDSDGLNNYSIGENVSVSGNNNMALGQDLDIDGSGNTFIGSSIVATGNNNVLIGSNLNLDTDNSIVLGVTTKDIVIASDVIAINSGLGVSDINIYSNSAASGIFISNNKIGINTKPTGVHTIDIEGSGRIANLSTDSFRLGVSATSGSILAVDSDGYGTWNPIESVSNNVTSGLLDYALVTYDDGNLVSASGLYWDSGSGVLYTDNSNNIIPTGNNTFVINNSKNSTANLFNIKGSVRDDLFLIETQNDRIGINTTTPTRTVDASGNLRVYKDSLFYLEKTDDNFIIAYDNGVAQTNKFDFTASGLYFRQTTATPQVLPELSYGVTYPSLTNVQNSHFLIFDDNLDRMTRLPDLTTGFDAFSGSSDN
jgi:hypothetical protein